MGSQQWFLDGHLTHGTSEIPPVRPLTPDSSVSVVDTGLEWIEREFPFRSNLLWSFVLFLFVLSHCFIYGFWFLSQFRSLNIIVTTYSHAGHLSEHRFQQSCWQIKAKLLLVLSVGVQR